MKKTNIRLGLCLLISLLLVLGGVALVCCALLLPVISNSSYYKLCLWGGAAVSVVCVVVCIVLMARLNKATFTSASIRGESEEVVVDADKINYIPSQNVFDFVTMGNHQTVEEKFAQIALMDKTQFVIYMAKLFSLRGYQVRLTTVVDNRNIDMLVEKKGVIIAVGCIKSDKVLSVADVASVKEGLKYYNAHSAMALTNTYFDRSALEFARAESMSLVDRTILMEDFF